MTLAVDPLPVAAFGIALGAVLGLLALGLVLIYRTTGILNFAHWAVGLLGVAVYALASNLGVPAQLAVIPAIAVSIVFGVLGYQLVFSRVSRSQQIIVILITIGMAQLFASLASMAMGDEQFTTLPPWLPTGNVAFGDVVLRSTELITIAVSVVVAFGFLVWFKKSRSGRALRAVAQNREAAVLAGIDDVKYSSLAWGLGSALAALALLMQMAHRAGETGGVVNAFDLTPLGTILIPAFGAALVGGLVNLPAALVGGVVFGLAREMLILAPKPFSEGAFRTVIAASLIVLLLLLRTERFFASQQELEALET